MSSRPSQLRQIALLVLVLASQAALGQRPIEGEVTGRQEGRVRVEYRLPDAAAPRPGDPVEFRVLVGGLPAAAGAGEVTAADWRGAWVRFEGREPAFGAAAVIQASGNGEAALDLLLGGLKAEGCGAELVERYRRLAEAGRSRAQTNLGAFHYSGCGVPRDTGEAFRWTVLAAEQGQLEAMSNLYSWNLAADRDDPVEAYRWAHRAFQTGAPIGLYLEGSALLRGVGVDRDETRGAGLVRRAAEAGLAPAQGLLGYLYMAGRGLERNPRQAVSWYRAAARQGDLPGFHGLGLAYWKGHGVEANRARAEEWLSKAAAAGYAPSQAALDDLLAED